MQNSLDAAAEGRKDRPREPRVLGLPAEGERGGMDQREVGGEIAVRPEAEWRCKMNHAH